MFNNDNPPLSSIGLQQQASIERNLVIQARVRAAVRASAKWFRPLVLRGTRLASDLTAERHLRIAIRELQRLDDRRHRPPARRDRIRGPQRIAPAREPQAVSIPLEQRSSTTPRCLVQRIKLRACRGAYHHVQQRNARRT
jgi:hypothetical protein